MNTKEFEALRIGNVVRYVNERAEYIVTERMSNGMYKVQCTRVAATASLWERIKGCEL